MQDELMPLENSNKSRRLMHTRSIECQGFLRDDGLWEVEAWLRDTKPFAQPADRFRPDATAAISSLTLPGSHAGCLGACFDTHTHTLSDAGPLRDQPQDPSLRPDLTWTDPLSRNRRRVTPAA